MRLWMMVGMCFSALACFGGDWFQYRGPDRNGVSNEKGLIRGWSEQGPRELWRIELGPGFSGMSISDGRVYSMDSDTESEYAISLDAASGKVVWRVKVGELFTNNFGNGPRSTPTVDGDRVYVLGSMGNLHALNKSDGAVLWSVDFKAEFEAKVLNWAFCASPLVFDDQLIMEAGGTADRAIVSFDKNTGKVKWTAHEEQIAYSSPIAITFNGKRQLVFMTAKHIFALDRTGKELWRSEFVPRVNIKPAMPVFVAPDLIFASASYDAGAKAIRLVADGDGVKAEDVWSSKVMRNHFNTSVALDGHLYGFDKGMLKCIEAATGTQKWVTRGLGKGSLIYADGMLIVLSERGKLQLAEASTESFKPLASHQVLKGRCWTQPTLTDGRLYVRNGEELVCIDMKASRG